MSQNDYIIANQSAPDFRSDLNDALQALVSLSSGSTAPSTTYANMLWYDTLNNILKMRTEADDAWINVGYLDQSSNAFRILDDTQVVNTSGTQTGLLGGQATSVWEDGTSTTRSLVSPAEAKAAIDANASASPAFIVEDQKAEGTAGGTASSSSWNIRDLNTIVHNPNSVISLSSNEFTVTDDCYVEFSTPSFKTNGHTARIWNVTDSVEVARGTAEYNNSGDLVQTSSFGCGFLTTGKTYRLETYTRSGNSGGGLGQSIDLDGVNVFSVLKGWLA